MSFAEFSKLEIVVGSVEKVERIEGKDRLYVLKVKADRERTLVAGLRPYYKEDELEGKKVLILANLEPKKIGRITSEGMVLATVSDDVALLEPLGDVPDGTRVV